MGGLFSYFWGYPGDDEVDPANGLTGKEKRLVIDTWAIMRRDSLKLGVAITLTFLTKYPEYQSQFRAFKEVPLKDLPENKKFQAHCMAMVNGISETVDSLKDSGLLEATLLILGEKHHRRGQSIEHFQNLKPVWLSTFKEFLGSKWTPDVEDAWKKILDTTYNIIFKAYA